VPTEWHANALVLHTVRHVKMWKRWMWQLEQTHKCALLQQLFLFSTWTTCSRGRGLCKF